MTTKNRNLIISPVGDASQHSTWTPKDEARNFDLALIYFGKHAGTYRDQAEYYFCKPGFKFFLIADALEELGAALDQYDYVWIPDDDIAAGKGNINRLFEIARQYNLEIAQPAIAEGDVSFRLLRQQPDLLLRYTRFAEVMCPLFSRSALQAVRGTFKENISSWGIDWAWTRMVDNRRIAVIDAVGVHHTRPLASGDVYKKFAERGVVPTDECRQQLKKHGLYGITGKVHRRQVKYGTARCDAINLAGQAVRVGPPWWRQFSRVA